MNKILSYKSFEQVEEDKLPLPVNVYGNPLKKLSDVTSDVEIPLQVGDTVFHKRFGKGEVLDINGNLVEIKFNSMIKSSLLVYDHGIFDWNKTEEDNVPKEKKYTMPTKAPKMLIDRMVRRTPKREPKKTEIESKYKELPTLFKKQPYKIGDTVNHKKFGEGEIIDIKDNILSIKFSDGLKKVFYKSELFK